MFPVTISVLLEMLVTVPLCRLVPVSSQLMQMDMAMATPSGTLGISLYDGSSPLGGPGLFQWSFWTGLILELRGGAVFWLEWILLI
jgi:hypothetical protein